MTETYQGKCHCGAVQFTVELDSLDSFYCNCSYCKRRSATLIRVDEDKFTLTSGESNLGVYGSRDFSKHYFCKTCGINCFTKLTRETGNATVVNTGCIDEIEFDSLSPSLFDGANKL
ncbi:GFA family protein [Sessilibacter sp. MAH2]